MAEKILNSRIVNKHDSEENWLKATGFTPKQGELIVYDIDENYSYERIKIGDGVQNVNDLSFYASSWEDLEDRPLVMESATITYDGSTDGYVASAPALFYKVSDFVLTKENIIGQSISLFNQDSVNTATITEDMIMTFENPNSFVISEFVACIAEDNTIFNSYTFPEKGVYFANINGIYIASLDVVNIGPFFDEKYISNTIARRKDIVQSDWSEGNQYSLSYVKNKTHYYCEGASMVKELSLTVTDADFTNIGPYITFEEGKKYKVVIDGVSDMCTAVHVEDAAAAKNYIELTPSIDGFGIVRSRLTGGVCTYISGVSLGDHVLSIYEDNELKQLDEMFIPDTIARVSDIEEVKSLVGDVSVSEQINAAAANNQSDWSVNDETSPAYVKNRPFYTTDVEKIQLYNGVITFQEDVIVGTTVYIGMADQLVEYNAFKKGQEIQIIFDGVEYNLTLKQSNNTLYAGNGSIINVIYGSSEVDTGEAFCYIAGAGFVATTNEAEHVITTTVNHSEDIVIPHKYLGLNIGNGDADDSIVANDISNTASGDNSFAAGYQTTASGNASFAQGKETVASGDNSHAEGNMSEASSYNSHAEGNDTTASGHSSHSEGIRTEASGQGSHAEGSSTKASAWNSHSEGQGTEAASKSQHVFGEYNIVDKSSGVAERGKYIQIAGNGGSSNDKSNAYTLDWDGNAWFKGAVKVGGTGQDDETAKELATQEYVQSFLPKTTTITLPAASWTGDANPWSQVVTVNGVTANSKVDLQPTAVQIVELQDSEITLMMQNDDGVVTAWAIGNKPTQDYEMQVLITEVVRV